MNDYYMNNWVKLRTIEGASQRVQEDTRRFAATMETLGVSLLDSVFDTSSLTNIMGII